jgi:hypothetical protein
MARTASARTTTRRTPRPIAVGLVAVTAAIIGTLVYQAASSPATPPPRPGTAQPSPVTPRNGPLGTIAWPASGVSAAGISGIGVLPGPGGCILLAAWQQARGHDTLIVAATFGQPGTMATMLPSALQAGHQLMLALGRALAGQSAPAHQRQESPKAPAERPDRPPQSQRDSNKPRPGP